MGERNVLHARAHNIALTYQASIAGTYRLRLRPVTDEISRQMIRGLRPHCIETPLWR